MAMYNDCYDMTLGILMAFLSMNLRILHVGWRLGHRMVLPFVFFSGTLLGYSTIDMTGDLGAWFLFFYIYHPSILHTLSLYDFVLGVFSATIFIILIVV